MFIVYLNEGIKVLYRMGYSFFKLYRDELQFCNQKNILLQKIEEKLKKLTLEDKEKFIEDCFKIRLVTIDKQFSALEIDSEKLPKAIT